MFSNVKKESTYIPVINRRITSFIKLIQTPRIAISFLLLFAFLGWVGAIDTVINYFPSDSYNSEELHFFSVLRGSLERSKEELLQKKAEFKKTHDTLLDGLEKSKKEFEQLNKQNQESNNSFWEIEYYKKAENYIKRDLEYLKILDKQSMKLFVSIDELIETLPTEDALLNVHKSNLRNALNSIKKQFEQYETSFKNYISYSQSFRSQQSNAVLTLFLQTSEFAKSIQLLNTEVAKLKSSDTSGRLQATRNRLLISFGALKAINGAVSIVQSIETGGSVVLAKASVRFGEWLDPMNDLVEQASEFILFAVSSILIQEFLFAIGNKIAFSLIMPIGLFLFAISYFVANNILKTRCQKLANSLIILALFAKLLIPTSVFVSDYVMETFLLEKYTPALSKINENRTEIEKLTDVSFLTKISENTEEWLKPVENITFENIFMLVTIFLFETILLPITIGLILLRSFQFFVFYR